MNRYSTQGVFGYFGRRWACAITTLVIIFEHFRGKQATPIEIERIAGRFLLLGNSKTQPPVYVSNYKDHKDIFSGDKVDDGWGAKADPEAHFYIRDWKWAAREIADIMKVNINAVKACPYTIGVMDVDGDPDNNEVSTHFVPRHQGVIISNPSPGLIGPIEEIRPFLAA